jgi:hypothetical protein
MKVLDDASYLGYNHVQDDPNKPFMNMQKGDIQMALVSGLLAKKLRTCYPNLSLTQLFQVVKCC